MRAPDYKMIQGGNIRSNMSASAATRVAEAAGASGRAFAKMGEDLQSAGMEVAGMFEEAEKIHNEGKMAEYKNELDTEYSNFQNNMMSDPNRSLEWRGEWDKVLERKQAELDKLDISGNLRNLMTSHLNEVSGDTRIRVSHASHKTTIHNANNAFKVRAQHLMQSGRYEEAEEVLANAPASMPSYAKLDMMQQIEDEKKLEGYRQQFTADPYGWDEGDENEPLEGLSMSQSRAIRKEAKAAARRNEYEAVNEMQRQIDGGVLKTEEEVIEQAEANNMSPTAKRQMVKYHATFNNEQIKAYWAEPENQNAMYNELGDMLRKYDPEGYGMDMDYADMKTKVLLMPDTPRRELFLKELDQKFGAAKAIHKGKKDIQRDILRDALADRVDALELTKPTTIEKTAREFIDDGFLRSEQKLGIYFDEEEVEKIMEATEKIGTKKVQTEDARMKMFRKLWGTHARAGNTRFERNLGKAIGMGKLSTKLSSFVDEEAGREYSKRLRNLRIRNGAIEAEFLRSIYFQNNPTLDFNDWMRDQSLREESDDIQFDAFGADSWDDGDDLLPSK